MLDAGKLIVETLRKLGVVLLKGVDDLGVIPAREKKVNRVLLDHCVPSRSLIFFFKGSGS